MSEARSRPVDPAAGAIPFAPRRVAATVDEAILSRRSVRAFAPTPVLRATVEEILAVASRAPSGSNIQPWNVIVLAGQPLARITRRMHEKVLRDGVDSLKREYEYYPVKWFEPYHGRRRKLGWSLYGLLGIGKDDKEKMVAYHARNYLFFDAPVGMVFTIHRDLELGSWLDYGTFLQNIMLAARGRGLDTCPQFAIAVAHSILEEELGIPPEQQIVCGMALGHAAPEKVNELVTLREPPTAFARFEGFADGGG